MKLARAFALLVGITLACGATETAQAQMLGADGAQGFAHPGFFGYLSSPYATGRIPTPPYFAIHPPVYYSAPVPRSYGYSPYAYPGTVRTPDVSPAPQMIHNPHAKPTTLPVDSEAKVAQVVTPQIIVNPFVSQSQPRFAAN